MRGILDSAEVFNAHAWVDYCYLSLSQLCLQQKLDLLFPDKEGPEWIEIQKDRLNTAIELYRELIEAKLLIHADPKQDQHVLNELLNLKNAYNELH